MIATAVAAPLRGVIEGFYGVSWPDEVRGLYAAWLAELGLNCYLYAPKSDRYLRRAWTEPWPDDEGKRLRVLSRQHRLAGIVFGIGLSPFSLYQDYGHKQRDQLKAKVEQLNTLEAPLLAILFDDMPGNQADLAARQADIVHDCLRWTCAERLAVCPTYYSMDPLLERVFGTRPEAYWSQLGESLPVSVDIFWTGNRVCAAALTASDLTRINAALRRPVTLWDNYPVNDGAARSRHLYMAPPPARDVHSLREVTRGHLCNGMNQPRLTLSALAGLAGAYCPETDEAVWLARTLGESTYASLRRDAMMFRDLDREQILEDYGDTLLREYEAQGSPAAREVVAWLQGHYAFDPDCLTD